MTKYPIFPDDFTRMAKSEEVYLNGSKIKWDKSEKIFKYIDGVKVTKETIKPCPICGEHQTNGCDPCLGVLPGVESACCGHGVKKGYIIFSDGTKIKGEFSITKEKLPLKGKWW